MVRLGLALTVGLALLGAPSAAGAPPREGLVVPGRTLGGLALGATRGQVRAAWGTRYGVCRDCRAETWYFNHRKFEPQGAGVTFRRGRAVALPTPGVAWLKEDGHREPERAVALFTMWSPPGWRTPQGLRIGDPQFRVSAVYGSLFRVDCGRYSALTMRRGRVVTSFYVVDEQVWGFGLSRPVQSVCR